MAMSGYDINSFHSLRIDPNNVSASWSSWFSEFKLMCDLTSLKMGPDNEGNSKFSDKTKLLTIAHCIGSEGRDVLKSKGFNIRDDTSTYAGALQILKNVYEQADSVYVKTMRFVTVSQSCGEIETDYIRRVEKLSRDLDFGTGNDNTRANFAVAIAVNGLRDPTLRKSLIEENELGWDRLVNLMKAKKLAKDSNDIISEARAGATDTSVKPKTSRAVDLVRSDFRRGRYQAHEHSPDNSSRHYRRRRRPYRSRSRDSSRSSRGSLSSASSGGRLTPTRRYSPERRRQGHSPSRYEQRDRRYSSRGYSRHSPRRSHSPSRYSPRRGSDICYECKEEGHHIRDCPKLSCFKCGEMGHMVRECPRSASPRSRHYDNRYSSRSQKYRGQSPSRYIRFSGTDNS